MATVHEIRKRAEAIARGKGTPSAEDLAALSPEAARQMLHEVRVHQIELEMQNEELRRTQAELEAARARYFNLYDLAPMGYVTLSDRGLILEANLTACTLLGTARGAIIGQLLSRFIFPEDADTYYVRRTQLIETRAPQVWELRMVTHDGRRFWARLEATVEQEEGAAPVCRVVLSDITETTLAQAEKDRLEALNRQLQKSESLGRMAGAIAHHFNNQLQVVIGHLEIALLKKPEGGEVHASLTEALQASRIAGQVSGLMLTYLGQTVATREALDLSEACRRSLPMLQAAMPKNVRLDYELPSPGPVVDANANQMHQVVTNLVTNAWEAGGSKPGTVRLSVKTVAPAEISASYRFPVDWQARNDAYACLEVADTGCGIAASDISDMFDPFFSSRFVGRGMGLPVALGILRGHEGAITVESTPGSGSIFRVYVPISAEPLPGLADNAADASDTPGQGTVLLVDDEDMVRHVAEAMLAYLGFAVIAARDGVEAVELFRQHRSDIRCVLCDVTMRGPSGLEVLTALRRLAPDIPVILASGYTEAQVMDGARADRPQAYLHKPYPMAALKDALAKAIGGTATGV
jgi:two-component system, cell cycle sensor histidine kinase and response regulator CckA